MNASVQGYIMSPIVQELLAMWSEEAVNPSEEKLNQTESQTAHSTNYRYNAEEERGTQESIKLDNTTATT
jgi:hypothetical protein